MTDFNMPPGVSARDIPGQDEAIDEITRLRAELATMTNDYFRRHRECGDMAQEVIRLRAEVEALREDQAKFRTFCLTAGLFYRR